MARKKGLPRDYEPLYAFKYNGKLALTVRGYSAVIFSGTIEEAALAMADAILVWKKNNPGTQKHVWGAIEVQVIDGKISLNLTLAYLMDKEMWASLQKDVEKICNDLTAFM